MEGTGVSGGGYGTENVFLLQAGKDFVRAGKVYGRILCPDFIKQFPVRGYTLIEHAVGQLRVYNVETHLGGKSDCGGVLLLRSHDQSQLPGSFLLGGDNGFPGICQGSIEVKNDNPCVHNTSVNPKCRFNQEKDTI